MQLDCEHQQNIFNLPYFNFFFKIHMTESNAIILVFSIWIQLHKITQQIQQNGHFLGSIEILFNAFAIPINQSNYLILFGNIYQSNSCAKF